MTTSCKPDGQERPKIPTDQSATRFPVCVCPTFFATGRVSSAAPAVSDALRAQTHESDAPGRPNCLADLHLLNLQLWAPLPLARSRRILGPGVPQVPAAPTTQRRQKSSQTSALIPALEKCWCMRAWGDGGRERGQYRASGTDAGVVLPHPLLDVRQVLCHHTRRRHQVVAGTTADKCRSFAARAAQRKKR
eukprot:1534512-Rhodomonas_salina.2